MAKGKKSVSHAGPHKNHGPKRKLFHQYDSTTRLAFGQTNFRDVIEKDEKGRVISAKRIPAKDGILTKYNDYDSFALSCAARGKRNVSRADFNAFIKLDRAQQDEYLQSIGNKK